MTTFYHASALESARAILKEGFRDKIGFFLTGNLNDGVWLSDAPLHSSEGAKEACVLKVETDLPIEHFAPYEWVEEPVSAEEFGNDPVGYDAYVKKCAMLAGCCREWLMPAALINEWMTVSYDDENSLDPLDTTSADFWYTAPPPG